MDHVTTAPRPRGTRAHHLSLITVATTLLLVAVGGFTRGSGSGYGCADRWPLCEDGLLGGLLPRAEYHMIVEWSHRWLAAMVGVLAVLTAVQMWRHHRPNRRAIQASIAAVIAVAAQAWVGRNVVKRQLDADLVTLHLVISMAVVAFLVMSFVFSRPEPPRHQARDVSWLAVVSGGAVGSLAVLVLGSLVHNQYVAGWPLVFDTLVPDLSSQVVTLHFFHRVAAGVMAVYLLWLVLRARRAGRPAFERIAIDAAAILHTANIGLGAAHVFTRVQSPTLVAVHLALASLVWALTVAAATAVTHAWTAADRSSTLAARRTSPVE